MFSKVDAKKNQFLEQTKAAREERALDKRRDEAAIKIQALIKGFLTRQRIRKDVRKLLDELLCIPSEPLDDYNPKLHDAVEVFKRIREFMFLFDAKQDQQRFEYLCRYLLVSMDTENIKLSYVSLSLNKSFVLCWIQQLKEVLWQCCSYLKILRPENHCHMKTIMVYLRILVTFTSTATWKMLKGKAGEALGPGMNQLCNNVLGDLHTRGLYQVFQVLLMNGLVRSKPSLNRASLSAITTLALRPLVGSNFSDKLLTVFLLHVLSVPGYIYHVSHNAQEVMCVLVTHRIFKRSMDFLTHEQSTRIIFNSLEGNYALCLLANLIHLGYSELEGLVENTLNFMSVMIRLLEKCKQYVLSKHSNLTHWHPVLGWFAQRTDTSLHESMRFVVQQLQLLWSEKMIKILFSELLAYVESQAAHNSNRPDSSPKKNILKKAFFINKNSSTKIKLESPIATSTCLPCVLYQSAIQTLTELKKDILGGLSYNETLLPILWKFLCDFGPNCGLPIFLGLLNETPNATIHPIFSLLMIFCETATHLIITMDDIEMYEQQKVFKVEDYVEMSDFLNQFVFKVIWNGLIDFRIAPDSDVFIAVLTLLNILYARDNRRLYTSKNHWLLRDVKVSYFLSELEKGRRTAQFLMQRVPHIIPFTERVILFRKNVVKEKDMLGLTESACASPQNTLITVHRSRIVEDGYRQLAQLPSKAMKGLIRVKFINEQGLDEAGIDQDGVFKEFLEETIKKVFDPALNLFKVTSEQKLYPSSTSSIQENHLALFEFVGKMLGKAVYESIVVDVPFASFFLSQILEAQQSTTYSSLDELPSLDPELAKSLSYIKHYDGDISDLELTYSCDEDFMGKIETHELVPGGKAFAVTNENKIRYVHLMAHFRMYRQIKYQTLSFINGFKSVINNDWLLMFSAPELQKLISGDTVDLDIDDLRRHTQYYGGYHNNHKVINWLWNIVANDFSPAERGLFLKFVTSCSKPPLLGFAHLEPPFSIRCVEVSDDQDTGDTVGSVLKGFLNIRRKDPVGRLPTSSTCFNLLKLPNYQKKSSLREKLKYAIHSNTGFELS